MKLKDALEGISARRYYALSGYSYQTLEHYNHQDLTWKDLNPSMQRGILELINGIWRVQKMVYSYDIEFVTHSIKSCGIEIKWFYDCCDIGKSFAYHRRIDPLTGHLKLIKIRLQLLKMLNRLFRFVLA